MGEHFKFDYDDILITPAFQTDIESRYVDINPYYSYEEILSIKTPLEVLPLMTAPMTSVINRDCIMDFISQKIIPILPRTENPKLQILSVPSYGLNDFPDILDSNMYLLDVANGHMKSVLKWCEKVKKEFPKRKIMAGNVANPSTMIPYINSGVVDFIRLGIGNGNGCLTTQQTGIGYPMGSLISESYQLKKNMNSEIKIVADGGIKKTSDIIKALALGADYVMIGSLFSKALESAAPNYWKGIPISKNIASLMYKKGFTVEKKFWGMSTKKAQKDMGNSKLKTSEGVIRMYNVEYTLPSWVENFESYLRSAMSYTNSKTLSDFVGSVHYNFITQNSFNRFNK